MLLVLPCLFGCDLNIYYDLPYTSAAFTLPRATLPDHPTCPPCPLTPKARTTH